MALGFLSIQLALSFFEVGMLFHIDPGNPDGTRRFGYQGASISSIVLEDKRVQDSCWALVTGFGGRTGRPVQLTYNLRKRLKIRI